MGIRKWMSGRPHRPYVATVVVLAVLLLIAASFSVIVLGHDYRAHALTVTVMLLGGVAGAYLVYRNQQSFGASRSSRDFDNRDPDQ